MEVSASGWAKAAIAYVHIHLKVHKRRWRRECMGWGREEGSRRGGCWKGQDMWIGNTKIEEDLSGISYVLISSFWRRTINLSSR